MDLLISALIVLLGSGLGGALRYVVSTLVDSYDESIAVYGTFLVNVLGSAGLAALMIYRDIEEIHPTLLLILGGGFFGGFTTYSTFNFETFVLISKGEWGTGLLYLAGTVISGLLGAYLGAAIVSRILLH